MLDIKSISNNLELGHDGIWYSKDIEEIPYPPDGNEVCYAIEEKSFWFKHRNNCILTVVKSYPPESEGTIFDIGGGNGFVSLTLASSGFNVALLEPGRIGASNAKNRGLNTVICASTTTAKFKPHSLSAVGLFDVVEHIEDDLSIFKSLGGLLKREGRLYITVPAYSFLWSEADISAMHHRRYTLGTICDVIKQAGFEMEFSSYFFRLMPIPIALFRALPYRIGLSLWKNKTKAVVRDHFSNGGVVSKILASILNLEVKNLQNKKRMIFGGSCIVVAKNLY